MLIKKVGVIGAGVMGTGVAQALAETGHEVVLVDIKQGQLDRALESIGRAVRLAGLFGKPDADRDPDAVLARVETATDMGALRAVDFAIENVVEEWEVKKAVYGELDSVCKPDCVFAANTSAIPVTKIGAATRRPALVLGMHFMNPVPAKPTVEVIRGHHTSEQTIECSSILLGQMGKKSVVVNDSPGFVSNRVLMLTINEAIFLLQEGVATEEQVDQVFKECFGHKMGPLETADLIGLDTILLSLKVLYEEFNDPKYRPCTMLKRMVDAGLYGKKNGRGFYDYYEETNYKDCEVGVNGR